MLRVKWHHNRAMQHGVDEWRLHSNPTAEYESCDTENSFSLFWVFKSENCTANSSKFLPWNESHSSVDDFCVLLVLPVQLIFLTFSSPRTAFTAQQSLSDSIGVKGISTIFIRAWKHSRLFSARFLRLSWRKLLRCHPVILHCWMLRSFLFHFSSQNTIFSRLFLCYVYITEFFSNNFVVVKKNSTQKTLHRNRTSHLCLLRQKSSDCVLSS